MKLAKTTRARASIPTASMSDIAFLLIIFFMVTTVYDVDRTNVDLPLSATRVEAPKGSAYVVLNKDRNTGSITYKFSDGKEISRPVGGPNDIYLEASRLAYADPSTPFIIKADSTVRYLYIDEILDQLRKAGVQNLLLLTQQRTVEGEE